MLKKFFALLFLFIFSNFLIGQVAVNSDGNNPDESALLDVSDTTKGMLIPRMRIDQVRDITTPAPSLIVYVTDTVEGYYYNSGTAPAPIWTRLLIQAPSNGNVLYVSENGVDSLAIKGSSRDCFTLDGAISASEDGDLIHVFPGYFTQDSTLNKNVSIYCEDGSIWHSNDVRLFNGFSSDTTISLRFYTLQGSGSTSLIGGGGDFSHPLHIYIKNNFIENLGSVPGSRLETVSIENSYCNDPLQSRFVYYISGNVHGSYHFENIILDSVGFVRLAHSISGSGSYENIEINNLKINTNAGALPNPNGFFHYAWGSDAAGLFRKSNVTVNNTTFNPVSNYSSVPASVFSGFASYGLLGAGSNGQNILGMYSTGFTEGSAFNHKFYNFSGTGHGLLYYFNTNTSGRTFNLELEGRFEKGVPIFMNNLQNMNDSKMNFHLDVVCDSLFGAYIGLDNSNLTNSGGQIMISGRIESLNPGMPCIIIKDMPDTYKQIVLKDLVLINDGTVPVIQTDASSPIDVVIMNVRTNTLSGDANITEVGDAILRSTDYK